MRGAVCFALALHMNFHSEYTQRVMLTTTLLIVLFTILFLGGATLPLMNALNDCFPNEMPKRGRRQGQRRSPGNGPEQQTRAPLLLSKTQEMVKLRFKKRTNDCRYYLTRPSSSRNPRIRVIDDGEDESRRDSRCSPCSTSAL